mmetsp:Transcript_22447/g.72553  ORF Transcript_22447/g.72553 Transcript_22447/m.72553 type:complete len:249 (-) Transcript_22447:59-805(-)
MVALAALVGVSCRAAHQNVSQALSALQPALRRGDSWACRWLECTEPMKSSCISRGLCVPSRILLWLLFLRPTARIQHGLAPRFDCRNHLLQPVLHAALLLPRRLEVGRRQEILAQATRRPSLQVVIRGGAADELLGFLVVEEGHAVASPSVEFLQQLQVSAVIPDLKTPNGQAELLLQPFFQGLHVSAVVIALPAELDQVLAAVRIHLPLKREVRGHVSHRDGAPVRATTEIDTMARRTTFAMFGGRS